MKNVPLNEKKLSRRVFESAEFQAFLADVKVQSDLLGAWSRGAANFTANVFTDQIFTNLIQTTQARVVAQQSDDVTPSQL